MEQGNQSINSLPFDGSISVTTIIIIVVGPNRYIVWANAYGPLYNFYGLSFLIYPALPRIIGTILYLIVSWKILKEIQAHGSLSKTTRFWLYLGIFGNLFSFVLVAVIGSNEVYVAFFICAAILALKRGDDTLAGAAIGLGALIKFYPLYLVPFFAIDHGRLNIKFTIAAGATFVAGMALAYLVWGSAIFKPLTWNLDRNATPSSIIYVFQAVLHALPHVTISASRLVLICLVPLALMELIFQYKLRLSNLAGLMIGYVTVVTFNQIGYVQYYFPLMLAIYLYYLLDNPPQQANRALVILFFSILFQAIVFALAVVYRPDLHWVRIFCKRHCRNHQSLCRCRASPPKTGCGTHIILSNALSSAR